MTARFAHTPALAAKIAIRAGLPGLMLGFLLACSSLLGTPLEQMEGSYQSRLDDLQAQQARAAADPALAQAIQADVDRIQADYAALPAGGAAREEQLGPINQALNAASSKYADQVAALDAAAAAANEQAVAPLKRDLVGKWTAPGYVFDVSPGLSVHYESSGSGTSKSIDAPIINVTPQGFDVGIFGINTHFDLEEAPHQNPDGSWAMKLSGVTYTR